MVPCLRYSERCSSSVRPELRAADAARVRLEKVTKFMNDVKSCGVILSL